MKLVPAPPTDVRDCAIFRRLRDTSTSQDGLAERAEKLVKVAGPLLDLIIGGPFQRYTLHNPGHARKLVHLAEHLVGASTLNHLSALECTAIIYSAYLHDLGMALTSTERDRIIKSVEFQDELRDWPELWERLELARKRISTVESSERLLLEAEIYQLQEVALSSYLRPRHASAERYTALVEMLKTETGRSDLFELNGVDFEQVLIDICVSHNQNVSVLAEVSGPYDVRFSRDVIIGGQPLNTQFCAALLRLTDILDFDRERTPAVLFQSLGIGKDNLPGSRVSLEEWQKHMAVHAIEIGSDEIVVSADCRHPAIEAAVRHFCFAIEREIRDTSAVLKRNTSDIVLKYSLDLPLSVRPKIRSLGYVYKDLSLRMNHSATMKILMGERLYKDPGVAIRELIQNAMDACSAKESVESSPYEARINVRLIADDEGRHWLQVDDNGIGMDEHVLSQYFLEVGKSYYSSPEYERQVRGRNQRAMVSRFGIGLVSVFLIGDILEVVTCNATSARGDNIKRYVRVEDRGGLAFVKELGLGESGTTVKVRLKQKFRSADAIRNLDQYLRTTIVRPQYPVSVLLVGVRRLVTPNTFMSLRSDATESYPDLEFVQLDLSRFSNIISGKAILAFGIKDGLLIHDPGGRPLSFGGERGHIKTTKIFRNYGGNRLSVNGFLMSMKRTARIFRAGGQRQVAFAYDIDISGIPEVVYDVARDRIVGTGVITIKAELQRAIEKGLRETGIFVRLSTITQKAIRGRAADSTADIEEDVLNRVQAAVPTGNWPKDLANRLAVQLAIPVKVAGLSLSRLLATGRATRDDVSPLAPIPLEKP